MKFLAAAMALTLAMASPPKTEKPSLPSLQPSTLQETRWNQAQIPKHKRHAVERIVAQIVQNGNRYRAVSAKTGVPWWAIAGIHNMEAGLSFSKHLHEGSPLSKRTRYIPKGRPKTGNPPFTWEFSAQDALRYDKMDTVRWDEVDNALYRVEAYNGTGYLRYHKSVPTPYLWSFTSNYSKGKYVADGKWSSTAVSQQCGVAALWIVLMERFPSEFPDQFHQYR